MINLDAAWVRYGAIGILFYALIIPVIGVFFFFATAMGCITDSCVSSPITGVAASGVAGMLDAEQCGNLIPETATAAIAHNPPKTLTRAELVEMINTLSEERKLPAALIAAKIKQESDFRPDVTSEVGARGISQVMPETYDEINGDTSWKRAKQLFPQAVRHPYDPYYVMYLGSGYLRTNVDNMRARLKHLYPSGPPEDKVYSLAIAAYNSGRNLDAYDRGELPSGDGYAQTRKYVEDIMGPNGYYQQFQKCQTLATTPGVAGDVTIEAGANRPGAELQPGIYRYLQQMAGIAQRPIIVTTGTDHQQMVSGSDKVSDHWAGNAADLHIDVNGGATGGDSLFRACLIAGGKSAAEADRLVKIAGVVNIENTNGLRVQCIWKTNDGGNHYDHVHVGARPAS